MIVAEEMRPFDMKSNVASFTSRLIPKSSALTMTATLGNYDRPIPERSAMTARISPRTSSATWLQDRERPRTEID